MDYRSVLVESQAVDIKNTFISWTFIPHSISKLIILSESCRLYTHVPGHRTSEAASTDCMPGLEKTVQSLAHSPAVHFIISSAGNFSLVPLDKTKVYLNFFLSPYELKAFFLKSKDSFKDTVYSSHVCLKQTGLKIAEVNLQKLKKPQDH